MLVGLYVIFVQRDKDVPDLVSFGVVDHDCRLVVSNVDELHELVILLYLDHFGDL